MRLNIGVITENRPCNVLSFVIDMRFERYRLRNDSKLVVFDVTNARGTRLTVIGTRCPIVSCTRLNVRYLGGGGGGGRGEVKSRCPSPPPGGRALKRNENRVLASSSLLRTVRGRRNPRRDCEESRSFSRVANGNGASNRKRTRIRPVWWLPRVRRAIPSLTRTGSRRIEKRGRTPCSRRRLTARDGTSLRRARCRVRESAG